MFVLYRAEWDAKGLDYSWELVAAYDDFESAVRALADVWQTGNVSTRFRFEFRGLIDS